MSIREMQNSQVLSLFWQLFLHFFYNFINYEAIRPGKSHRKWERMKMKLKRIWEKINISFWFLPCIIIIFGILLAFLFVHMDMRYKISLPGFLGRFTFGQIEGARAVLSSIASSMITIAGIIFSITIVTLVLASSQMGPRLLRNFIKSKLNQVVLGSYVGSFIYCLLILRVVSQIEGEAFVPNISVTFAILQAIGNIILLIIFINHVATSIQADNVVTELSKELDRKIGDLYPEDLGTGKAEVGLEEKPGSANSVNYTFEEILPAQVSNYLESVEQKSLMELAVEKELLIRYDFQPGHYIARDTAFIKVCSQVKLEEKTIKDIYSCFNFANRRSPTQDPEFVISQIVEVAVRALSPGINDPFTVIICIDKLGAGIGKLTRKKFPSAYRYGHDDKLRIITKPSTFNGLMDAAFNQIRQYGKANPDVMIRLMDTFREIAEVVIEEDQKKCVLRHAEMVNRAGEKEFSEKNDIEVLNERFFDVVAKLNLTSGANKN